jgi:hypothetical protein
VLLAGRWQHHLLFGRHHVQHWKHALGLHFLSPLCTVPYAVQAIGLFRGPKGGAPGGGGGSGEGAGSDSTEAGQGGSGSGGTLGQSLLNQMQERLGVQQRVKMVPLEDMATVCSNEGERWLAM